MDGAPQRIEYEIDPLAPRELRRGNKIRIACNQDDLICLAFETQGCDVQADPHIHTLLNRCKLKILISKAIEIEASVQKLLQPSRSQFPLGLVKQMPKTQRHLPLLSQFIVQGEAENRLGRFGKIDRQTRFRLVGLFRKGWAIVEEYPVKFMANSSTRALFLKVGQRHFKSCSGNNLRIGLVFVGVTGWKPAKKEAAVDQNCGWH
jgi:hypothetical protein